MTSDLLNETAAEETARTERLRNLSRPFEALDLSSNGTPATVPSSELPVRTAAAPRRNGGCFVAVTESVLAPDGPRRPANLLLRRARLRASSPSGSGPMSQRELAEAMTAYIQCATGRDVAMDRHYVSRLERGARRWPNVDYRAAFRAVLGAESDADLGFFAPHGPTRRCCPGWTTRCP